MNQLDNLRIELLKILCAWEEGGVSTEEVHHMAESWMIDQDCPELERNDPYSAVLEVVSQLDILNQQLITVEDVPAIKGFLQQAQIDLESAWLDWERYWESIDFDLRKMKM